MVVHGDVSHDRVVPASVDLHGRAVTPVVVGEGVGTFDAVGGDERPLAAEEDAERAGVVVPRRSRQHGHAVVVDQLVVDDLVPATSGSDLDPGGSPADPHMIHADEAADDRHARPRAMAHGDAGEADERACDADTRLTGVDQGRRPVVVSADDDGARAVTGGGKTELSRPRAAAAKQESIAAAQPGARRPGERPPSFARAPARAGVVAGPRVDVEGTTADARRGKRRRGRRSGREQ